MRLLCYASGGCKWTVIKEEWLKPDSTRLYSALVRFHECVYCKDTKAAFTSPKDSESFFCIPDKFCTVPVEEHI